MLFIDKIDIIILMKKIQEELKKITELENIPIEPSTHATFASSVAFMLSKKAPYEIAVKLAEKLKIEGWDIYADNGYLNFTADNKNRIRLIKEIIKKGKSFGKQKSDKKMLIDYSSPNIAKSFGVGHLRSTIIGQALYNLYEFLGWECIGDNHIGDWGTQFGRLIYMIKKLGIKEYTIERLEELYVEFHKLAEKDESLNDMAREEFVKLEKGENIEIWEKCKEISLKEFDRIYKILGVKIDYAYGESHYIELAKEIIKELKEKRIAKQSKGAWIVEPKDLPVIILEKSDGSSTYFARDLAAIKFRIKEFNPDLFLYEVGSEQSLYWKQVFKTAEALGFDKEYKHINHGLIVSPDGKKFSTRKGNTIHLDDVILEAIKRAEKLTDDKEIAKQVGIGAIKYNDLSQDRTKNIVFDWDKILNQKGNSGPYIQYTYARCNSVLEKKEFKIIDNGINKNEKEVIDLLFAFDSYLEKSRKYNTPHHLCNYIYSLCQKYNYFYNEDRIIGSENEGLRLGITQAVSIIIKTSLGILGIETPKKM